MTTSGLQRAVFRPPLLRYRLGLGGLLGGWFMLLTHVGRRTDLLELRGTRRGHRSWCDGREFRAFAHLPSTRHPANTPGEPG